MRGIGAWVWICLSVITRAQAPLSVDPSFQFGCQSYGLEDRSVNDAFELPDGRLLLSGFVGIPGYFNWHSLFSINEDGSLHYGDFSTAPYSSGGRDIAPWNDRLYVIGGYIRRYHMTGALDTAFHPFSVNAASWSPNYVWDMHPFEDGSLLVAGSIFGVDSSNMGFRELFKLTPEGFVDTAFVPVNTNSPFGILLRQTPEGLFIFGGEGLTLYNGQSVSSLVRIDQNGNLDTTFHAPVMDGTARDIHFLDDGRMIIGGEFKLPGDTNLHFVVRLLHSGELDTTFNPDLSFWAEDDLPQWQAGILDIEPFSENRYILTGRFWSVDDEHRGGLCMIDSSGNLVPDELAYWGCDSISPNNSLWSPQISGIRQMSDGYYYVFGRFGGFDDGTGLNEDQRMLCRLYPANVSIPTRPDEKDLFRVFPNPADEHCSLWLSPDGDGPERTLRLLDAASRTVMRLTIAIGQRLVDIDTRPLAPGSYTVVVDSSAGNSADRTLIVRH